MNEEERLVWKRRLEGALLLESKELWNSWVDELTELGHFVTRWKNSSNCSDGCCELDQFVLEEYASERDAYWAAVFQDNAIRPLWSMVLDIPPPQ